jgi:hypothetical protein
LGWKLITGRAKESLRQNWTKPNESRRRVYALQRESWQEELNHVKKKKKNFGRETVSIKK